MVLFTAFVCSVVIVIMVIVYERKLQELEDHIYDLNFYLAFEQQKNAAVKEGIEWVAIEEDEDDDDYV